MFANFFYIHIFPIFPQSYVADMYPFVVL